MILVALLGMVLAEGRWGTAAGRTADGGTAEPGRWDAGLFYAEGRLGRDWRQRIATRHSSWQ